MKIYLDTNVVSAIATDDSPLEATAISLILKTFELGGCQLCTSAVTGQEIETYQGTKRIDWAYRLLTKVPYVSPWTLGFTMYAAPGGGIETRDESEDNVIWATLQTFGLDENDAHHVMEAVRGECQVFLTCDRPVLRRANLIEEALRIRVLSPSQLVNSPDFPPSE